MTWSQVVRRWVVAAILAAAAVWAWWGGAGQGAFGALLPGADPAGATRIEVTSHRATSVFQADGLAWKQSAPYACIADALAIRDMLDVLATMPAYQRFDTSTVDRAVLGLEDPVASIEVGEGEAAVRVDLGRRAPAGRAWVAVGDQVISTTDALHAIIASGDPRQWRDPALFERLSPDLDRIALRHGDRSMVLARQGQRWTMEAPIQTRADADAVGRLIELLGRVRGDAWVEDLASDEPQALARFGLDAPAGSVSVSATTRSIRSGVVEEHPNEQVVEWGSVVERGTGLRVARRRGVPAVVTLDERALESMDPAPESLIDGRMVDRPASSIRSIEVAGPTESFRLERRDGAWVMIDAAHPIGAPTRDGVVASLLTALTEARALALNESGLPEGPVPTTITLDGFDGAEPSVLSIVRERPGGRWGAACGDGLLRIFSERLAVPLESTQFVR